MTDRTQLRHVDASGREWAVTLHGSQALRGTMIFDPPVDDPRRSIETHDRFIPDPEGFEDRGKFGPFNLFVRYP